MGWREINMNRRKPVLRLAVVPVAEGESREAAIIRKVGREAVEGLAAQVQGQHSKAADAFLGGFALGVARQKALKLGLDCEAADNAMAQLIAAIPAASGLAFSARQPLPQGLRSRLTASWLFGVAADAGYLAGQLEAVCGMRKLAGLALRRVADDPSSAAQRFITDCDIAADRLQSHQPTLSTRFTPAERAIVAAGIAELVQASGRSA